MNKKYELNPILQNNLIKDSLSTIVIKPYAKHAKIRHMFVTRYSRHILNCAIFLDIKIAYEAYIIPATKYVAATT
jgi:hypothetical protein